MSQVLAPYEPKQWQIIALGENEVPALCHNFDEVAPEGLKGMERETSQNLLCFSKHDNFINEGPTRLRDHGNIPFLLLFFD